ncbi:hypothetical protein ACRAWD_31295 [Caulobacter segnis]
MTRSSPPCAASGQNHAGLVSRLPTHDAFIAAVCEADPVGLRPQ